RFMDDLGLAEDVAATLTSSRDLADFFEKVCAEYDNPKKVSNFISTELLREYAPEQINNCPVSAPQLAALLLMVEKATISGKIAKTVFADMLESGDDPEKIVKAKGLVQMSDEGELVAIVREIIAANPDQAQQFRDGKTKVMGFFVGQLMQKTKGKANPQLANKLFAQELG
ncbi:MAG: Asp-tRNA(Asn)/Glu-tRNA(Gln) amidotransferase GatCAB subunit B, partial [Candidatus Electrothrix sp. ATG1]|nr:Asp-tRNA(Asn)/Glu-tRNA(Gln) amidotransferase GatCAB subunit B [Candidatus Electrothrix sp. ATG1]